MGKTRCKSGSKENSGVVLFQFQLALGALCENALAMSVLVNRSSCPVCPSLEFSSPNAVLGVRLGHIWLQDLWQWST